jgi:shikimate kinase
LSKSIVLIGFMGVGKTTVGQLIAEKLNREFIDTDAEIEKEYGMPVTEIFEKIGEKAFRDREKSLITSLCKQEDIVLSLGGGAFMQDEIRKVCLETCVVIYLNLSFERWLDRLELIIDSRPVLQGKTVEEILQLYNKRKEIYANHHLEIISDEMEAAAVADEIVRQVQ